MTDVIPIEELAPACLKSPSGRHCGHDGCLVIDGYTRLTCCHCGDQVRLFYIEKEVRVAGHGPFMTEEVDATDYDNLPGGWDFGVGLIA